MEEEQQVTETDLERRITEAFSVFDHAQSKNIDVRDVGAVIRSLELLTPNADQELNRRLIAPDKYNTIYADHFKTGCCPTEAQLQEVVTEVEDPNTGQVSLERFLPYMVGVITEYQMQPASAEALLRAFQVMDQEKKGFVTRELLSKNMLELGEPFTEEELEEMMAVAVDPESGNIPYEYYINQIMVNVSPNIYSLIPPKKAVKRRKLGGSLIYVE